MPRFGEINDLIFFLHLIEKCWRFFHRFDLVLYGNQGGIMFETPDDLKYVSYITMQNDSCAITFTRVITESNLCPWR